MVERQFADLKSLAENMFRVASANPCIMTEQVVLDDKTYSRTISQWNVTIKFCLELHGERLMYHLTIFRDNPVFFGDEEQDAVLKAFFGGDYAERVESGEILYQETIIGRHWISRRTVFDVTRTKSRGHKQASHQ